ncbi:MAG: peptidase domain-containing ABC transporter [Candidatus Eisenbacteria bacterium]|uniref:Peptidase domain-containing ABC transporter n=1 Tax=Eiseniibacteriota bacterium TaxID=2212470 RepID=A0A956NIH5_UNCEI|nr:peptidase domain-containing ABC transporter [Candidatus Eisenbacteria bacterium]
MRFSFPLSRPTIPHIQQLEMADCGPACLTMVLGYHGHHVTLDEVRDRFATGRDGASAYDILEVAKTFGLDGRAVQLDLEDLDVLPTGSILHWRMSHFVLLEKYRKDGLDIVDPDGGSRFVPSAELNRSFTGVAILLEPGERFEETGRRRSPFASYLRRFRFHSGLLARTVILSVLLQILAMALPLATGTVVDRIVPSSDESLLLVLLAGIGLVSIYTFLTSFVRAHMLLALRTHLDLEMTTSFTRHLLRLPFSFFQLRQTGDLMMRLNSNTTIRELLTAGVMSGLLDGILVAGYLVVILWTNLLLGGLVILLGAFRIAVFLATKRKFRILTGESLQALAETSNYEVQMIEGIETLKTAGAERRAQEIWSNLFVDVLNVSIRRGRLSAIVDSLLYTLELASPLLVLAVGTWLVLQDRLTLGTMLAVTTLAAGFLRPLGSLVTTALSLQQLWSTVERVDDVLRQEPEQEDLRPPAPTLRGEITLRGVSFRYGDRSPWAVDSVDLDISAGTQIAIVGPSGSGKSTLARLLAALYLPTEGDILFDGESLLDRDFTTLRRQLGFVPQHPFLFGSTIRANISMADGDVALKEVEAAAELADIHREIDVLPLRYETPLASTGSNLSGGQRQRIALARALLRRPPILVLDEATSHLDTRSERRVFESLRALDVTRIVIAHRLSTVVDSDLIVVMDQGRIVERGRHDELTRAGGLYAELARGLPNGG